MNKVLPLIKRLFLGIKPGFLFKSYFFAGILFYFMTTVSDSIGMNIYYLLCLLIFPFANLVWNDLMNTLFGNMFLILNPVIMIAWKGCKYLLLYSFAPIIAPIGIIYILISQKYYNKV